MGLGPSRLGPNPLNNTPNWIRSFLRVGEQKSLSRKIPSRSYLLVIHISVYKTRLLLNPPILSKDSSHQSALVKQNLLSVFMAAYHGQKLTYMISERLVRCKKILMKPRINFLGKMTEQHAVKDNYGR